MLCWMFLQLEKTYVSIRKALDLLKIIIENIR